MTLTPQDIITTLGLSPHPTCGFVKQTFVSKTILPKNVLPSPFSGARPAGQVLYFMVTPETQIRLHKIHSDQMYHFYLGTPLEVLMLYADGNAEIKIVGNDLKSGMQPQLFIPGDTFHVSRLHSNGEFALLGTSEWPGVAPDDVELGDPNKLIQSYPTMKDAIINFTKR